MAVVSVTRVEFGFCRDGEKVPAIAGYEREGEDSQRETPGVCGPGAIEWED